MLTRKDCQRSGKAMTETFIRTELLWDLEVDGENVAEKKRSPGNSWPLCV